MDAENKIETNKPKVVILRIPSEAALRVSPTHEARYHPKNTPVTAWIQLIVSSMFIALGSFCLCHALTSPVYSSETDLFLRHFDQLVYGPLGLIGWAVGITALRNGLRLKTVLDRNSGHE